VFRHFFRSFEEQEMKVFKGIILAVIVTMLVVTVRAQDIAAPDRSGPDLSKNAPAENPQELISTNYSFSIQAGVVLEDMSSGTTDLIAPGTDNNNSIVTSTGFLFRFLGNTVTNFSVNGNGVMRMSATPIAGPNNTNQIVTSANAPRIMPYWDDLCVGSSGKVHSKTIGSAGSRKLVVEWENMKIPRSGGCEGTGGGTFQVWLFEHTGVIQFVYGSGIQGTADNGGYSAGMGGSGDFASITTAFGTIDYTTANDSQTNPITAGTSYLFTPAAVAAPTGGNVTQLTQTSLQLNWTDNTNNEVGYYIRRSLTGNEPDYINLGTLPANSTSFSDSGLGPGTQYFYIVNAISDSAISPDLLFSPTTLPPNNVPSTALGGLWSAPSTWANGAIPLSQDNVTIAPGATVIIDTAAVAGNVTVGTAGSLTEGEKGSAEGGTPAVLRFGEAGAFSLTVAHSVTIGSNDTFSTGAGNGNQHVLSVGGDLINNGTLDFSTNGNTAGAGIVFTGASNNTFGGTGPVTDIRTLTIDKGISNANILDLTVSNFTVQGTTSDGPASGYLFLNKGTFKISGTFTGSHRTFGSPTYQIVAAAGFWLNNPNYTVVAQNDNAVVFGSLRVSAGTYNVGTAAGHSILIADNAVFNMEGGAINVTGRFGAYDTSPRPLSYTQSGGTVTTCTIGHTSTALACFDLGTKRNADTSVVMTGGDIVIQNHPPVAGAIDYRNEAGTGGPDVLTGGTVHFGNALTNGVTAFAGKGWFPNIALDTSSGSNTLTLSVPGGGGVSNMGRDVNIGPGGTFDIGNTTFNVLGNSVINNGVIKVQGTASNFIFGRGLDTVPVYSGSGTWFGIANKIAMWCNTLTLDPGAAGIRVRNVEVYTGNLINANRLILGNNDTVVSSVTFGVVNVLPPSGTFDTAPAFDLGTGGQSLSYLGSSLGILRTIGPELNPARTLVNLTYNDGGYLTVTGGDLTINNILAVLHPIIINSPDKIIVNGGVNGGGAGFIIGTLKWRISQTAVSYIFPVGSLPGYSPVEIHATSIETNPTYLTVTPVDTTLPGLLPATSATRYWKLEENGHINASLRFTYLNADARGDENAYKLWKASGGAPVQIPSGVNANANTVQSVDDHLTDLTGDWGIGAQLDPGPVSISGSVTQAGGQPIANATLTISGGNLPAPIVTQTGSFGLYQFSGLQAGETYNVRVDVKRYRFSVNVQPVTPTGNVTNVNFVANPQE
jgi:hypothetical protein